MIFLQRTTRIISSLLFSFYPIRGKPIRRCDWRFVNGKIFEIQLMRVRSFYTGISHVDFPQSDADFRINAPGYCGASQSCDKSAASTHSSEVSARHAFRWRNYVSEWRRENAKYLPTAIHWWKTRSFLSHKSSSFDSIRRKEELDTGVQWSKRQSESTVMFIFVYFQAQSEILLISNENSKKKLCLWVYFR